MNLYNECIVYGNNNDNNSNATHNRYMNVIKIKLLLYRDMTMEKIIEKERGRVCVCVSI